MVALVSQMQDRSFPDSLFSQIQFCLSELKNEISDTNLAYVIDKKIKEMRELLIEYILQNMVDPNGDKTAIGAEISKVLDSIRDLRDVVLRVKELISSLEHNPKSWTPTLLDQLKLLVKEMEPDALCGDSYQDVENLLDQIDRSR